MSDNDMGGRKMNSEEEQNKKPTTKKAGKINRAAGKLKLINGGASKRSDSHLHERLKQAKGSKRTKRPTRRELREEREETSCRVVNKRFVNAGVCCGLIAFLGSYLLPEYKSQAPIIGICAGSLVYVGLHIVNFVMYSRQIAYKLGFFILSTLLLSALIYTLVTSFRG